MRIAGSLALVGLAVLLAVAGVALCLWAVYQYLAVPLGPSTAALLTGVITLALAGIFAWIAGRASR